MGPRSDFSKLCQGAAEKSANATRKALTTRSRCGSQPVGMSTGRPAAKIEKTPPICVMKRRWAVFCSIGLELASDTAHARLSMISAHFSIPMTPLSSAI